MTGSTKPARPTSRDLLAAMIGAIVGATLLALAASLALNRALVLLVVALGFATIWSALQWRESTDQTAPDDSIQSPPPISTATAQPSSEPQPATRGQLPPPAGRQQVPAVVERPADDRPVSAGPQSWVPLDDLTNEVPIREYQCGHCASYQIVPGPGPEPSIDCHHCGHRTELDPFGRPHGLQVRSNPERERTRTASLTHTPTSSSPTPNTVQEKNR